MKKREEKAKAKRKVSLEKESKSHKSQNSISFGSMLLLELK